LPTEENPMLMSAIAETPAAAASLGPVSVKVLEIIRFSPDCVNDRGTYRPGMTETFRNCCALTTTTELSASRVPHGTIGECGKTGAQGCWVPTPAASPLPPPRAVV
jgi:hypothetical protein